MLSPAQERALLATADYGDNGEGWAEVELQFECATPVRDRDKFPGHLWPSLCVRVFGALERKGYIVRNADGPRLTDYGRQIVAGLRRAGKVT